MIVIVAGLAVGIGFVLLLFFVVGKETSTNGMITTVTGEVVCLPHKKGLFGGGVETSECTVGFYGNDGRYYGLNATRNDKGIWLFQAEGSKELFHVTGTLRAQPDSIYDITHVIDISSAATADGSISIYEVYSRHYGELTAIAEEISNKTGGGYSMGIDRGCDNIAGINEGGGGKSCMFVVLEKDVPELSSKIPRELEGYRVYVVEKGYKN